MIVTDWQERISQAARILEIDPKKFADDLTPKGLRAEHVGSIDSKTFAALVIQMFPEAPPLLLDAALNVLKGGPLAIGQLEATELIGRVRLIPQDPALLALSDRLIRGSNTKWGQVSFVVKADDGAIDLVRTRRVMTRLENGDPARSDTFVDTHGGQSEEYPIYRLDELVIEESKAPKLIDPLFPDRVLDSGGVSTKFDVPILLKEDVHRALLHLRMKNLVADSDVSSRQSCMDLIEKLRPCSDALEAGAVLNRRAHIKKALGAKIGSSAYLPEIFVKASAVQSGNELGTEVDFESASVATLRLSAFKKKFAKDVCETLFSVNALKEMADDPGMKGNKDAVVESFLKHDPLVMTLFERLIGYDFEQYAEYLGVYPSLKSMVWTGLVRKLSNG